MLLEQISGNRKEFSCDLSFEKFCKLVMDSASLITTGLCIINTVRKAVFSFLWTVVQTDFRYLTFHLKVPE